MAQTVAEKKKYNKVVRLPRSEDLAALSKYLKQVLWLIKQLFVFYTILYDW